MGSGIVSWGVYLPYWRLERSRIAEATRSAAGRGRRAVASYDEDTTSMGVEAARRALAVAGVPDPTSVYFSTPAPAYLDKTNAATIHAAIGLPMDRGAYDLGGSPRSGWAAASLAAAAGAQAPTMAILSDLRTGLPGSSDESQGGDGAVAFVFAPEGGVADALGRALGDRRIPRSLASARRDGVTPVGGPLRRRGLPALSCVVRSPARSTEASVATGDVDYLVVAGLHARAVATLKRTLGVDIERVVADHAELVGNLGTAAAALGLADVLERATPGQVVVLVSVADGADVLVLRTTDALPAVAGAAPRRLSSLRSQNWSKEAKATSRT